jgi:hypothetical protein
MVDLKAFQKWAKENGYGQSLLTTHAKIGWTAASNHCNSQPDWSDSETSPSALWKNSLCSVKENLQIADGAVHFAEETIKNLRTQLAEQTLSAKQGWSRYETMNRMCKSLQEDLEKCNSALHNHG